MTVPVEPPGLLAVVEQLGRLGLSPMGLRYEAYTGVEECILTITFHTFDDLQAWCAAEGAAIEHIDRTVPLGHHEYSTLYARPGRRVLAVARVFPEVYRWHAGASS